MKYDKTARAAIQQIKDRHYTQALEGYAGEILAVGINYDKNNPNKPHSCVIERLKNKADAISRTIRSAISEMRAALRRSSRQE